MGAGTTAEAAGVAFAERRAAPRYRCAGAAEIVVPGHGLHYAARIVDLSAAGCFLETDCRLERGSSVEIWLHVEDLGLPLRLRAHLLARRGNGAGFRFQDVSARKAEQIGWLTAELARRAAAQE